MTELIQKLEQRAAVLGLPINELCRRAKIRRSTFTRWKSDETQPTMRLYQRVLRVLEKAERAAERTTKGKAA